MGDKCRFTLSTRHNILNTLQYENTIILLVNALEVKMKVIIVVLSALIVFFVGNLLLPSVIIKYDEAIKLYTPLISSIIAATIAANLSAKLAYKNIINQKNIEYEREKIINVNSIIMDLHAALHVLTSYKDAYQGKPLENRVGTIPSTHHDYQLDNEKIGTCAFAAMGIYSEEQLNAGEKIKIELLQDSFSVTDVTIFITKFNQVIKTWNVWFNLRDDWIKSNKKDDTNLKGGYQTSLSNNDYDYSLLRNNVNWLIQQTDNLIDDIHDIGQALPRAIQKNTDFKQLDKLNIKIDTSLLFMTDSFKEKYLKKEENDASFSISTKEKNKQHLTQTPQYVQNFKF
ncbi:hypothetical protein vfu_A02494 [Vibrio furnissii NCTC 11218]|nr:hypothetical protein vfu_A02494 [Vibrio furnissii NCTC 11218]